MLSSAALGGSRGVEGGMGRSPRICLEGMAPLLEEREGVQSWGSGTESESWGLGSKARNQMLLQYRAPALALGLSSG